MCGISRPLKAFLNAFVQNRNVGLETFEYHTEKKSTKKFFEKTCIEKLADTIPKVISLRFVRWEQKGAGEMLHDRFILTELGGVRFTVGLDEGGENEHTGVEILSKQSYEKQVKDYLSAQPAFVFVDEVTVSGVQQ